MVELTAVITQTRKNGFKLSQNLHMYKATRTNTWPYTWARHNS